jgi:intracellular multiplication protein IcmV
MAIFRRSSNKEPRKEKKPRINYRKWMDYDRIKSSGKAMADFISSLGVGLKPVEPETLQEAKERLHLSDLIIEQRKRDFFRLFLIILLVSACTFAYSLYLLLTRAYLGALVGTSVFLVTIGLCFRYHFWYIQLKHRKLGLSFREWWKIGILGRQK